MLPESLLDCLNIATIHMHNRFQQAPISKDKLGDTDWQGEQGVLAQLVLWGDTLSAKGAPSIFSEVQHNGLELCQGT